MQIHVARAGKEVGSFSSDEVRAGLMSGKFLATDFGWTEGQADWVRLADLPMLASAPPIAPQPPAEIRPPGPEAAPASAASEPAESQAAPRSWRPVQSRLANSRRGTGRNSRLASASLLLGILALSLVPLLPAIPAIICGHLARRGIRRSGGALAGDGLALGGLITGYLSLFVFGALGAFIYLMVVHVEPNLPIGPD